MEQNVSSEYYIIYIIQYLFDDKNEKPLNQNLEIQYFLRSKVINNSKNDKYEKIEISEKIRSLAYRF